MREWFAAVNPKVLVAFLIVVFGLSATCWLVLAWVQISVYGRVTWWGAAMLLASALTMLGGVGLAWVVHVCARLREQSTRNVELSVTASAIACEDAQKARFLASHAGNMYAAASALAQGMRRVADAPDAAAQQRLLRELFAELDRLDENLPPVQLSDGDVPAPR